MAKIPLRTYNREIEGMIDRGQAAQAISHGRHILKFFPKHIDTYRLLGKAFLELQRYAEAADVLERVLACVPDDFISQIGMGIIREDEGNLDAALWHMERAFEAQPSNVGVQEELRRLHGRRDGVEPAKIRLTRGALVRMYARGELFQQAIDEARAALAEDPQRTDLEVILARMYFLSGQKVSATEVCTRLITKLPFCFESNQILAEILPGTSREEDAKLYLQRVFAMDPYLEHLKPPAISSSEVPDNAVELEHLEWLSEQETGQPPEWTKTLGAGWEDQAEPVPEWITGAQFEPKSEEPLIPPQEPEQPESELINDMPAEPGSTDQPLPHQEEENQIPEWMQQAGWQSASGQSEELESAETAVEESEAETESEPIEKAEIPEWLAEIAPTEQESEMPEIESEKPDWLADILAPGSEVEKPEDEGEPAGEVQTEPGEIVEEAGTEPQQEDYIFEETASEQPQETVEGSVDSEVAGENAIPNEELSSNLIPEEIPVEPPANEPPVPEWLANLQAEQSEPEAATLEEIPSDAESLHEEPSESQTEVPEEEMPDLVSPAEQESKESPIETSEAAGAEFFEAEEKLGDTQPTQIKHETPPSSDLEIPGEEVSAQVEQEPEIPWLESFDVEKRAEEEPTGASSGEEELPDWMEEMLAEDEGIEGTTPQEEKPEVSFEPPGEFAFEEHISEEQTDEEPPTAPSAKEWFAEDSTETDQVESVSQTETAIPEFEQAGEGFEKEAPQESEAEDVESDATAFPWLENLADQQALEKEASLPPSEQPQVESQEWMKEQPEVPESGSTEIPHPVDEVEESVTEPSQPEPEEITQISEEAKGAQPTDIKPEPAEEALPEWLKEFGTEEEPMASEDVAEQAPEKTLSGEESLGWLEELTLEEAGITPTETKEEAPSEPEPVMEAPSAFKEDESILEEEAPTAKEALPEWLQGLDEEKSTEEPLPAFGQEETPSESEITQQPEAWTPEMAAEGLVEEPRDQLEDTSPVKVTPEPEIETSQSSEMLKRAQEALEAHNVERALKLYDRLIQTGEYLEDTINDLRDALYSYPIDATIWQALGDACMKNNRLQEALDAYNKAEELLR